MAHVVGDESPILHVIGLCRCLCQGQSIKPSQNFQFDSDNRVENSGTDRLDTFVAFARCRD